MFICVFAVLVNKVSLQVTVEGFIGGSVLLPCTSAEHDLKLQEVDVSWRHNGSKNVCDLIPHSNSIEEQDPRYKNRTKTFPEGYMRGNFSIKLSGLSHADAGRYICLITPSDEQETVELIINDFLVAEPTTEEGNKSTDQENQKETSPDGVDKSWLWILGVTLLTLVILIIAIIFRRKISSCLMSDKCGGGSETREDVSPGSCYKSVTADDRDERVE